MAKKKTSFIDNSKRWMKSHQLLVALLVPIVLLLGVFGYNKYLDWQNIQDMKTLLADFEQLERDLEAESGEEFSFSLECGFRGEKFDQSRVCDIILGHSDIDQYDVQVENYFNSSALFELDSCRITEGTALGSVACTLNYSTLQKNPELLSTVDTMTSR